MKPEKKYKWHKIASQVSEINFATNNLAEIEVAGKKICIAKTNGAIAACASKCPHAGGDMCQGFLSKNETIVCPVHRYVFSLTNGREVSGEEYYLKVYPVEIKQEGIFIGFEDGGLLSWLK
ncbi:MAG: Rieske 2Fe-2S domain-containing protein [Ginsengibacter sp.]